MNKGLVCVIDLGTTKVVCVAASTRESEIKVEGVSTVGSSGMKKGVVVDQDAVAGAIDEAISRVEREVGQGLDDVIVSVSGAHLQSVNAQGFLPIHPGNRPIRRDDVLAVVGHSRQVVLPADREQIMAVPREFRLDGERNVKDPIGRSAARMEVVTHVVTGTIKEVSAVDKAVNKAGRRVTEMVVAPLGSGMGVLPDKAHEEGALVVDIGASTTNVAVFVNGAVGYVCCLPVGSHNVTTDLAALLKVSLDEAERLKTTHGAALSRAAAENEPVEVHQTNQDQARPMQRRVLCEIVESRMREIASLVARAVERSGLGGQLVAGAYITGGGSMLPATGTLFGEALGISKISMAYPRTSGKHARAVELPTMSVAMGLAKYCLESEDNEFAPIAGVTNWKDKIRTITTPFVRKSEGR
ncbi:MAG: cell division protein FtsA [Chthonomonadaceae bacterium]|nr:cell division protein FtsA [Chthonomonadaceae bacterium]